MAPSYKEMLLEQRKRALGLLLSWSKDGVLLWGSVTIVADEIGVACSTISRLWGQVHRACEGSLLITPEIASRNNSRANLLKYSHAEFHQSLKEIPQCHHKTYHSTAKALRVSLNTVQQMLLHQDVCHVHMTSLKPILTEENKVSRMECALSFIDKNDTSKFKHMEDLIHIDEKWFYLTKDGQCFIIAVDKAEPYRHVQHRSFLTKIMFLCAVAGPRYDTNKNAWFDGKIGIWPIRKWEPVKRSSKKCTKGMPVWKNQSITWDVYREYLIKKLLPAIKQKWPMNNGRIRLQQDGTKSHILDDDEEFKEAVDDIGLNLTVYTQSPNSPDTNILDLGFFRAIQSFNDDCPTNEEELIKSVQKAYGEYPMHKSNYVWLTLQSCFNMIIENDGGNDYKIPHMGKESLEWKGLLPHVLDITHTANAWLNPMMEDDSNEDSDDSDDDAHVPMTTPTIEMDGEGGENATTDAIMNTGI